MRHNKCAVVWIHGEHDASTIGDIARLLAEALASGAGDIVIDLSGATFLGVGPVQLMMKVGEFLTLRGDVLEFRNPTRSARIVLDICGIPWNPAPTERDFAVITGASRALQSWVAVPALVRKTADRHIPSAGQHDDQQTAPQPIRIGEP